MMNWLWGAALLPLLFCGLMCVGGMVLAALGLRHAAQHSRADHSERTEDQAPSRTKT